MLTLKATAAAIQCMPPNWLEMELCGNDNLSSVFSFNRKSAPQKVHFSWMEIFSISNTSCSNSKTNNGSFRLGPRSFAHLITREGKGWPWDHHLNITHPLPYLFNPGPWDVLAQQALYHWASRPPPFCSLRLYLPLHSLGTPYNPCFHHLSRDKVFTW